MLSRSTSSDRLAVFEKETAAVKQMVVFGPFRIGCIPRGQFEKLFALLNRISTPSRWAPDDELAGVRPENEPPNPKCTTRLEFRGGVDLFGRVKMM